MKIDDIEKDCKIVVYQKINGAWYAYNKETKKEKMILEPESPDSYAMKYIDEIRGLLK